MNISQINPQIISITDLRRDVDSLRKVLDREEVAWVMRNRDVMFVAMRPEKYESLSETGQENKMSKMKEALAGLDDIRNKLKMPKGKTLSSYIIKMRDERAKKWMKK
jgi:hypothetical protein